MITLKYREYCAYGGIPRYGGMIVYRGTMDRAYVGMIVEGGCQPACRKATRVRSMVFPEMAGFASLLPPYAVYRPS
jgi:hypothetical protein